MTPVTRIQPKILWAQESFIVAQNLEGTNYNNLNYNYQVKNPSKTLNVCPSIFMPTNI